MLSFILTSAATSAGVGKERSSCRGRSVQAQRLPQRAPSLRGRAVPAIPASQGCGPGEEAPSRAVLPAQHPVGLCLGLELILFSEEL